MLANDLISTTKTFGIKYLLHHGPDLHSTSATVLITSKNTSLNKQAQIFVFCDWCCEIGHWPWVSEWSGRPVCPGWIVSRPCLWRWSRCCCWTCWTWRSCCWKASCCADTYTQTRTHIKHAWHTHSSKDRKDTPLANTPTVCWRTASANMQRLISGLYLTVAENTDHITRGERSSLPNKTGIRYSWVYVDAGLSIRGNCLMDCVKNTHLKMMMMKKCRSFKNVGAFKMSDEN